RRLLGREVLRPAEVGPRPSAERPERLLASPSLLRVGDARRAGPREKAPDARGQVRGAPRGAGLVLGRQTAGREFGLADQGRAGTRGIAPTTSNSGRVGFATRADRESQRDHRQATI